MMRRFSILLASVFAGIVICGYGRTPFRPTKYNLDFEYVKPDSVPTGWVLKNPTVTGYSCSLDRRVVQHGRASLRVQWDTVGMLGFGGFMQMLPGAEFAGKEVEVSCWIRTQGFGQGGYANMIIMEQSTSGTARQEADTLHAVRGTSDWTRFTTKMRLGEDIAMLALSSVVTGRGTAWFDNVEIRIDGRILEDPKVPELKSSLTEKEKRRIRKYLYPLRTVDPEDDNTDDLAIFDRLFGGCRSVGLGECTHGTSEVYRMKHRLVRYLRENDGFGLLAMEAGMPECNRIDDYISGGEGDPKQLVRGLYLWPWTTEEMLAMVEWMKRCNADRKKIAFTGVDMQLSILIVPELQSLLAGCPAADSIVTQLAPQIRQCYMAGYRIDPELARTVEAGLAELAASPEIAALPESERTLARQYIDMLGQSMQKGKTFTWRDRGMAANLLWVMEQHPDTKVLFWGHDQHVAKDGSQFPMGGLLKKELGEDYLAVGFACYEGSYTAYGQGGLHAFELPAPVPGTLEYLLEQLDEPLFVLDLKRMREDKALRWLDELEYREVGATPELFAEKGIFERFDYLIFIRETSPSHILKF